MEGPGGGRQGMAQKGITYDFDGSDFFGQELRIIALGWVNKEQASAACMFGFSLHRASASFFVCRLGGLEWIGIRI